MSALVRSGLKKSSHVRDISVMIMHKIYIIRYVTIN